MDLFVRKKMSVLQAFHQTTISTTIPYLTAPQKRSPRQKNHVKKSEPSPSLLPQRCDAELAEEATKIISPKSRQT